MLFGRWPDFPAIHSHNLLNARLFADRNDMIAGLDIPRHGKIAEIGVWQGGFSRVLIDTLRPRQFFAFDIFTGHLEAEWNGLTGKELFEGLTHQQYYEKKLAEFGDVVTVIPGSSTQTLPGYIDHSFDLVYVDAAHDFDAVNADAELAAKMVKPSGFLLFNDYVLLDPNHQDAYGVVPVANRLAVSDDWRVVGFALHHAMYCDIALRRVG